MIPLLTSPQIRQADAYCIQNEPITSIDLMERASAAFVACFTAHYPDQNKSIAVYCGTGNNGGDGLAIARLLKHKGYVNIDVKIARFSEKSTADFDKNFARLKANDINYTEIHTNTALPDEDASIIIDALLGSGLNKLLDGDYARLVDYLNTLKRTVIAVDVPTGLFTEGEISTKASILKANLVITFQQPKISFLLPESTLFMDDFEVVDIGIDQQFTRSLQSIYSLTDEYDIRGKLKKRMPFEHKGTYGHALIIAGQPETMGAALLCASACAHAGAGLTTACVPQSGLHALNTYQPEVMAIVRSQATTPTIDWAKFNCLAIGPGLGTQNDALALLGEAFKNFFKPIVIDADALNLLSETPGLLKAIPKGSIITPHMKEFDRLFGLHNSWWKRLETAQLKARQYGIVILLKNRFTIVCTPAGTLHFNPTGNPAMASGGMGDVLTGVIVALLAQNYTPEEACIIGAYIHGKAGDELAVGSGRAVVLAGQVPAHLPLTLAKLKA